MAPLTSYASLTEIKAAIDRTGSLPRDTDGTVPSPMIVEMRPLD